MRTLISGDSAASLNPDDGLAEPMVIVSERFWSGHDTWEVAGLDREIPKLLLDLQGTKSGNVFDELLADWKENRNYWIAVHPFLTDMQVWGLELPASVISAVSSHVSKEGLGLVTTNGDIVPKDFDVREVRATGERFIPENDSEDARRRVLRDAFALGAQYVELRDRRGRLHATASSRLVDLKTAVIAPMAPVPPHFSRVDPQGRCPMCKGNRTVTAISEALVIGNRNATPDSERFLTPEANAVMKRRSSQ